MDVPHYYGELVRQRIAGPFVVTESSFRPGAALPPHCHDSGYFTFTLHGSYRERYGSRLRLCTAGTSVAHPAFETHSQEFAGDPALLIRLALQDDERDAEVRSAFEKPACLKSESIARALFQLHGELRRADVCSDMIVEGLAYELTGHALRNACVAGGSRKRASCARMFIQSSLRRSISLSVISKQIGVSRTTLYRDFKSAFGCSPGDYLRRARLDAAASMLRKTALPVSEIAAECGFYDQSHFDRAFRLGKGIPPTEYRRSFG